MGGKNHQPCGRYLENSTKLSRSLSLAHAQLEIANAALEDVLLRELSNQIGSLSSLEKCLRESEQFLKESLVVLDMLKKQMEAGSYADLPPTHTLDLSSIGERLAERKIVDLGSWKKMVEVLKQGTFYTVIQHFKGRIVELHNLTQKLNGECLKLTKHVELGEVNLVLEKNYDGSIKNTFGQLYTAWSSFSQEFLASSLISTEIWYRHSDYGSLLDQKRVERSNLIHSS